MKNDGVVSIGPLKFNISTLTLENFNVSKMTLKLAQKLKNMYNINRNTNNWLQILIPIK